MAVGARGGRVIMIGLEEKNLEKLREGKPFHQHLDHLGVPYELVIFYGKEMKDLESMMKEFSGPKTEKIDFRTQKKN